MPPLTEPVWVTLLGYKKAPESLDTIRQQLGALAAHADDEPGEKEDEDEFYERSVRRYHEITRSFGKCDWSGKFTLTWQSSDAAGNMRPYDCEALVEHLSGEYCIRRYPFFGATFGDWIWADRLWRLIEEFLREPKIFEDERDELTTVLYSGRGQTFEVVLVEIEVWRAYSN
jgi:hypothetical protein